MNDVDVVCSKHTEFECRHALDRDTTDADVGLLDIASDVTISYIIFGWITVSYILFG